MKTFLLGKAHRWDLGDATLHEVDWYRSLARQAREYCKKGHDPEALLRETINPVPQDAGVQATHDLDAITWRQAADDYLTEIKRTRRIKTYDGYKSIILRTPEFGPLLDKPIGEIPAHEIISAIDRIATERKRYTAAEGALRTVKAYFSWLSNKRRQAKYGVSSGLLANVDPPERPIATFATVKEAEDTRAKPSLPERAEIGRVLAFARNTAFDRYHSIAIEALVLTAQRRQTVVSMLEESIKPIDHSQLSTDCDFAIEGWAAWHIPPYFMKTGRTKASTQAHVVPLVSGLYEKLSDFRHETADSPYMFPAFRARRTGQALKYGHVSPELLTGCLALMPTTCTPHGIRRAFTSYMKQDLGYPTQLAALILDHVEGKNTKSTTDVHYDWTENLDIKMKMMRAWWGWCEEQYQLAIRRDPTLLNSTAWRLEIERRRSAVKGKPTRPPSEIGPPTEDQIVFATLRDMFAPGDPEQLKRRAEAKDFVHLLRRN